MDPVILFFNIRRIIDLYNKIVSQKTLQTFISAFLTGNNAVTKGHSYFFPFFMLVNLTQRNG